MNYLIVDYGTTSCRASLVNRGGEIICSIKKPAPVEISGNTAEIDTHKAWAAVCAAIRAVLSEHPATGIAAVGISSLLGWVFLDKESCPLGKSMIWMDSRYSDKLEKTAAEESAALYRQTGRRLSRELLVAKWRWLRENEPAAAAATAKIISLKDEFVRRMTGEIVSDYAHLNYTMCWDIKNNRPDREVMALTEFPESLLAEGSFPYEQAGRVTASAAGATGLPEGVPVITGSIDGTTAMYGGGMAERGRAVMVSGTTDVLMSLTSVYLPELSTREGLLTINTGMLPGTYAAGGATGISGGALTRFSELLAEDYQSLVDQAEKIPPGSEGLLASPGLSGERAPYWNTDISGGLLGLRMNHTGGHIFRALMEGCAFRLKRLYREIFTHISEPSVIHTLGGCSQIDFWNQLKTDLMGIPLVRPVELEATTLGTAMFCHLCTGGQHDFEQLSREWVIPGLKYRVEPEAQLVYSRLFEVYEKFLSDNTGIFAALNEYRLK